MKKKILIALGVIAAIILIFIGIEYIQFLKATSRMTELSADLEKRIVEWEKKEYKRPPLFGPAIPGNAAEYYQQAESQMTELTELDEEVWIQWVGYVGSFKPLSPTALSCYEKAKPIIELVRKGNNAEVYKSLLNIRDGFKCKMPNLLSARNIANAMVIQGRELENNNQCPDALQLYCDVIRFEDGYLCNGCWISAITDITLSEEYEGIIVISEIGYEEIRRVILTNKLSEDELNKLISYLGIIFNPEPVYENVWDTEGLLTEAELIKYAKTVGFFPQRSVFTVGLPENFIDAIKLRWINKTGYVNAAEDTNAIYQETKRIHNLSYRQAKDEAKGFKARIKTLSPLSQYLIPSGILSAKISYLMHQAQRRGLYILCALEIYKARHQKYPEKLADLAPEIIQDVPLDPFSDQSFIYKVNPDGTIMLYSVGDNLKDDGGAEKRYNDIVIAPLKKQ